LIDASAIPENERVSTQATKKSRRGSRNKDEVEAYEYVKTQLMAMFQSPDSLQLAKDRINQILEFWHVRGKMIRNERFTSVFSLPPPVPGSGNGGFNAAANASSDGTGTNNGGGGGGGAPIFNTMSSEYITIPGRGGGGSGVHRTSNRSSQGSNDGNGGAFFGQNQASPLAGVPMMGPGSNNNNNNSHHSQNGGMYYQQQGHYYGGSGGGNHLQINDNDSVVSDSGMSSASRSPHPSFMEYNTTSSARSSGALNFRYTNTTTISAPEENSFATSSARPTETSVFYQQQFAQFQSQQLLQQTAQAIPIPALRFDRQGMLSWSVTTSLIYDLDALLQQNHGRTHFYLVDEQKVKRFLANEVLFKNGQQSPSMSAQALEEEVAKSSSFALNISYMQAGMGLGAIDKMLLKSNAVVTSWLGAADATQLRVFVEGWRNHAAAVSLQQGNLPSALGRRSASNSHVYTPPNGTMPMLSSAMLAETAANTAHAHASNSSTSMITDDNASVSSSMSTTNSRQPRLSRRRTTGGMDLKRDMAKLMQLQQQDQQQQQLQQQQQQQQNSLHLAQPVFGTNNNNGGSNNMFSPPKGMSPGHGVPSPSFTFNHKTLHNPNNGGSGGGGGGSALTSPLVGGSDRKSMNNNGGGVAASSSHNGNSFSSHNSGNAASSVISMLDYWQLLTTGQQSFSASTSRGILVFERSNEIGLVVRANAQYGLTEDLWCLYYPDDAMQQFLATAQQYDAHDRLAQSFAAYLMQLLPQLRSLMKYLTPAGGGGGGSDDSTPLWQGPVTVSYFAHVHAQSATGQGLAPAGLGAASVAGLGPPPAPISMQQYRTLGSLDQNAHLLLSRLASDAYFHEVVLL
jgi:hypothetical protein